MNRWQLSPIQLSVFCAIVYLIYFVFYFYFSGFIVCSTIKFGFKFVEVDELAYLCSQTVSPVGYDGQFFYRLALDPLLISESDFGVLIDKSQYRQQRILLPLITNLLTFGKREWVPHIFLAINYISLIGTTFVFTKILEKIGAPTTYAFLVIFYPGFVISISRSLSEPLAVFLLLLSVYSLLGKKQIFASVCLSLAVLARETALLVAVVGGGIWLIQLLQIRYKSKFPKVSAIFWLLPLFTFLLWQTYIYFRWGMLGASANDNLTLPFAGIVEAISNNNYAQWASWLYVSEIIYVLIFALCLGAVTKRHHTLVFMLWAIYGLLAACLSQYVWRNHYGFFRGLSEFHVFGFLLMSTTSELKTYFKLLFLLCWMCLWFLSAIMEIGITTNIWVKNTHLN